MSRFSDGYDEDYPNQAQMWWANMQRSFKSKGGTAALQKLVEALDAMPVKELAHGVWRDGDGSVCALGALAVHCGQDPHAMPQLEEDPQDIARRTAEVTGLPWAALYVIEYENDEGRWNSWDEGPAARWERIRQWAAKELEKRNAVA